MLAGSGVKGSFTHKENYHLTFAFIGECAAPERAAEAIEAVEATPFKIVFDSFGNFGNIEYLSMRRGGETISLMLAVRDSLRKFGINTDNSDPVPHITLARNSKRPDGFKYPVFEAISMTVNSLSLMQSELGSGRAVYTELYRKSFFN